CQRFCVFGRLKMHRKRLGLHFEEHHHTGLIEDLAIGNLARCRNPNDGHSTLREARTEKAEVVRDRAKDECQRRIYPSSFCLVNLFKNGGQLVSTTNMRFHSHTSTSHNQVLAHVASVCLTIT